MAEKLFENQDEQMRISLSEYEVAFNNFIFYALRQLMKANDPVLDSIKTTSTEHAGPNIVGGGKDYLELEQMSVTSEFKISNEALKITDLDALLLSVEQASKSTLESLMPQIFEQISKMCDASGNTINAEGKPPSYDMIIDMFEKIKIHFDDNDNMILPALVGNSALIKFFEETPITEEQKERWNSILERKKADYIAAKRSRKLY